MLTNHEGMDIAARVGGDVLYGGKQLGVLQGRAEGKVEDGCDDHRNHGIDQGGHSAHLGPDGGGLLGNAQKIGLIEVSHYRVGDHVKSHACRAGEHRGAAAPAVQHQDGA